MKTIKKKKAAAFRDPVTAEALDISDDIWAPLNCVVPSRRNAILKKNPLLSSR